MAVQYTGTHKITTIDANGNDIGILANPQQVQVVGTPTVDIERQDVPVLNVGQVTVTDTATKIVDANSNRVKIVITVQSAVAVFYGTTNGVTTSNGDGAPAIAGFPWSTKYDGAIYAIIASGSVVVTYREESIA